MHWYKLSSLHSIFPMNVGRILGVSQWCFPWKMYYKKKKKINFVKLQMGTLDSMNQVVVGGSGWWKGGKRGKGVDIWLNELDLHPSTNFLTITLNPLHKALLFDTNFSNFFTKIYDLIIIGQFLDHWKGFLKLYNIFLLSYF